MRTRKTRRRKTGEKKKSPFFEKKSTEQGSPFFSTETIQRKLEISKASDPEEKEAESVARKITAKELHKAEEKEEEKSIQKAEMKEEEQAIQKAEMKEEEKPVQKAENKEEEKPVQAKLKVQRKAADTDVQMEDEKKFRTSEASLEQRLNRRKGMGIPMPEDLKAEMEQKFGVQFNHVRLHTDGEAAAMCEQVQAMAFTHGNDIYFGEGQYNPGSVAGRELLAHELTHVVQQR